MDKILVILGIVALLLIVGCAMLTSLTTSAASLANGIAFAQMANTLLTSQCVGAIMALIALFGGLSIGVMVASRKNLFSKQDRRMHQARQLPAETSRRQIPQQPEIIMLQDLPEEEAVDDKLFSGWGF